MPLKKIRVAAVGLGWVALHRHLPVLDRSEEFEVIGVIDHTPGIAKKVADRRGYPRFAETSVLSDIEWLSEVDAITVATAPMSHFSVVSEALQLRKHILTEKPFAMSVVEGEQMVRLAAKQDRRLAIVHNFQFARSTRRLCLELDQGKMGEVLAINAVQFSNPRRRLPKWYDDLPLGLFYDESPHLLYLLRHFAGAIQLNRCWCVPSSKSLRTPARIDAMFSTPTWKRPISLHCNFESPISEWYLAVFGEKRIGIVDIFRDIYLSLPNDEKHSTIDVLRTSLCATGQHVWQHLISGLPHLAGRLMYGNEEVFSRFARAVNGDSNALLPIDGDSALAVLRLQHEIVETCDVDFRRMMGSQK